MALEYSSCNLTSKINWTDIQIHKEGLVTGVVIVLDFGSLHKRTPQCNVWSGCGEGGWNENRIQE